VAVGDEGGFAPRLGTNEQAIQRIITAIEAAGYKPGEHVGIALDCAASAFYQDGQYTFDQKPRTAAELVDIYADFCTSTRLVSIEDGLAEDDWDGWSCLPTSSPNPAGRRRPVRDQQGAPAARHSARRGQLHPDQAEQIGSLTRRLETIRVATTANYSSVISTVRARLKMRSIADLAVGTNAGQIKTGSLSRSDPNRQV